jgi:hypothetical protein
MQQVQQMQQMVEWGVMQERTGDSMKIPPSPSPSDTNRDIGFALLA